jgi:hypothetical protein
MTFIPIWLFIIMVLEIVIHVKNRPFTRTHE